MNADNKALLETFLMVCTRAGYEAQLALLVDFACDASAVMGVGSAARAGCIAIPTENTDGFEIVTEGEIEACAATLVEYALNQ